MTKTEMEQWLDAHVNMVGSYEDMIKLPADEWGWYVYGWDAMTHGVIHVTVAHRTTGEQVVQKWAFTEELPHG